MLSAPYSPNRSFEYSPLITAGAPKPKDCYSGEPYKKTPTHNLYSVCAKNQFKFVMQLYCALLSFCLYVLREQCSNWDTSSLVIMVQRDLFRGVLVHRPNDQGGLKLDQILAVRPAGGILSLFQAKKRFFYHLLKPRQCLQVWTALYTCYECQHCFLQCQINIVLSEELEVQRKFCLRLWRTCWIVDVDRPSHLWT